MKKKKTLSSKTKAKQEYRISIRPQQVSCGWEMGQQNGNSKAKFPNFKTTNKLKKEKEKRVVKITKYKKNKKN